MIRHLMAKLKLDLHEICKNGNLIEKELNRIIDEANEKRISLVEIISGKGSGQLKKTVLRFLERRFPFLIRGGIHFTDVRDAASAMLRAMSRPRARPVYHLTGTACSIESFFGMLEEISGVPAPRIVLPFRPAWLLASAAQRLGILLKGEPLRVLPDPAVIEMAARYWDIRSLYAAEELGHVPRDGRETLVDTVRWLRETQDSLD